MIDFIDILGDRHGAVTEYSIRHGVNGEKSISGTVYTNDEVIHGVDRGWRLEIDNEFYVITFAVPVDSGNETQLEFDAVHEFFYEFSKKNVYSTLNGSNTAVRYLDFIFNGSGYQYNLEVTIPAFEKEEFGMTNRLALFNDFIKSTGVEFVVNNRVVRILREVGTDLSTIVKKGFNMQELRLEKNLKDFVTYKRGFGAWNNDEDQSQGRLEAVYRSPLADLYGELEDEPLVDERFSVKANLEERLQSDVENSYSISVQLTMEDLTKAGYEYEQPRTGDYIMAMNEDLGFEQKIRIVNYESHYDVNGQLIDHDITCNSLGIAQKNASSAGLLNTINQALNNANLALERANYAVVSADGKTTNYFGEDDPIILGYEVRFKDTWYQIIGEDKVMNVWNGAEWEPITDTRVSKRNAELIAEQQAALEEVKTTADYSYDQLQQTIANNGFTDLDTAFGNVKTLSEQAESNAYNAMQKALDNASLIGGLDDSVSSMSLKIDDINNSLTLKANTTDINRIDNTITDINNELTFQSGELSSKVSQTVYNADINSIETTQTQLTQTFENFETSVIGPTGRLTLAEQFLDGFRNTAFDPSTGQLSLTEQTIAGLQDIVSDPVNGLETRVTTIANGFQALSSDVDGLESQLAVTNENVLVRVEKGDVYSQLLIDSRNILFDANDRFMISANKVVIDASEGAFITSAIIESLSADKITAGEIDANVIDVININVDSLVGNRSTFIQSYWNDIASSVQITSEGLITTGNNSITEIKSGYIYNEGLLNGELAQVNLEQGGIMLAQGLFEGALSPRNGLLLAYYGSAGDRAAQIDFSGLTVFNEDGEIFFGADGIQLNNGSYIKRLGQGSDGMEWSVPGFMHLTSWGSRVVSFYSGNVQYYRDLDMTSNTISTSRIDANSSLGEIQFNGRNLDLGDLSLGKYSNGTRYFRSTTINDVTDSAGANVRVTGSGDLRRSVSAKKYKDKIETVDKQLELGKQLLNLKLKSWYDKAQMQTTPLNELKRYQGLIAEDVAELGLTQFVDYQNDEIEGLYYDRLWIPLIPVVADHDGKIENLTQLSSKAYLKAESNEERIEKLEAELKLLKGDRE